MDNLQKRTADCISFEEQAEYCHNVAVINRGKNLRFNIQTLGCQMNEADSEQISGMLIQMGYTFIEDIEKADLVIINTCCVRENAEFKLYGHIGEWKVLKKANKNLITIVCGCMIQQKHVVEKIKNSYKYIDIVFGTHNRHELPKMLLSRLSTGKKVYEIWEDNKGIAENVPVERKSNIAAFVPITYGCDNFCSYCIVPYVRGRETSRDPEKIKQDIIELSQKGIKEITLLGQNVNSYNYGMDFSKLLYYISDVPGIERIRFMTSHPK
ncbi:MAG: radical SAM protein, partial [Clostridia bacterium]|nr:radical SAM protein [Clostridia bacterium]